MNDSGFRVILPTGATIAAEDCKFEIEHQGTTVKIDWIETVRGLDDEFLARFRVRRTIQ